MQGIEASRQYYELYGKPMLEEKFPELRQYIACGLTGSGSECFGFDDEVSRDHDYEPGFCMFLPGEDMISRRDAFLLERAYNNLPKEFMGMKRGMLKPAGGSRRGVFRTAEFFRQKTGSPDGILTNGQWLAIPETALAEAVNGEIFADSYGEVTKIRQLLSFYPDDIARKKLAGELLLMGQSGQYNYLRCLKHGESAAAQLAVFEFTRSTISVIFLLNRKYRPFYKWSFRALRALEKLSLTAELLEYLITSDNEDAAEKAAVMEGIAADVISELKRQGLTKAECGDLEKHAYSVNEGITDTYLRNMHILSAVSEGR